MLETHIILVITKGRFRAMIKMAAVVVLGVLFLTNGFGGFAAPTVWADSGQVSVILNGKLLETDPHSAYNKGSTVMIPLREASNALKYTTTYQKVQKL